MMSEFYGNEPFVNEYVDTDGDGYEETFVVDTDGDGEVDTVLVDVDGDGTDDLAGFDNTPGDGQFVADVVAVDYDGDGYADVVADDTDLDGTFDSTTYPADTSLYDANPYATTGDAAAFDAPAEEQAGAVFGEGGDVIVSGPDGPIFSGTDNAGNSISFG